MMRLQDKICIITGGGSGIGRAACLLFAREGGTVVVADKSAAAAEQVAASAGNGAISLEVDVAESASVKKMIDTTVEKFGRLDVLVNNAGYGFTGSVTETDEDAWNKLMQVN